MTPLEHARSYLARGWMPLPVPFKSKNPNIKGWPSFHITESQLSAHFDGQPQNVGVLLGSLSGELIDIDLDSPEAVILAPYFLPPTGAIFGRDSKRRSHWLYHAVLLTKK